MFEAFEGDRDRALFGICLYTGCRISEACSMLITDSYDAAGVRMKITLRKANTKGKQETRQIPVNAVLRGYLETYRARAGKNSTSSPDGTGAATLTPSQRMRFCERRAIAWG
ncbi:MULTISPECIES: site-specific integrase [Trichocoleus]|uniref:Site-specific integrase n=1 Tax=Trichocoleus desertorum GB2-A4 TaxID=2933944 RepID=A0ABV0JF31_9CYAN|nr:site-specific integrase [Trichocoleus sp. FACHB-46]